MTSKPLTAEPKPAGDGNGETKIVRLNSGRNIGIRSDEMTDLIEIHDPSGRVTVKVTLTETGPLISVEGAHLNLKSLNSLTLNAKKININSDEETRISTHGNLTMTAEKDVGVHSTGDDVTVTGKRIHLN